MALNLQPPQHPDWVLLTSLLQPWTWPAQSFPHGLRLPNFFPYCCYPCPGWQKASIGPTHPRNRGWRPPSKASSPSTLGVLTMGAWEWRLPGTDVPTPVSELSSHSNSLQRKPVPPESPPSPHPHLRGLPVGGANQLGSNLSTCLPWNRSKPVPGLGN